MSLLQNWRDIAYNQEADKKQLQQFWTNYFLIEKNIYEQLLSNPDEVVKGTVKELAEKYKVDVMTMVGFLDGINDSLVIPNPIEEMEEDTVVTLAYDKELLYKNMVDAKADWLYNLPMWDEIFTPEKKKTLYMEQKKSGTIIKGAKVGRNDPCPCGSGKKYKKCHYHISGESKLADMYRKNAAFDEACQNLEITNLCVDGCSICCSDYFFVSENEFLMIAENLMSEGESIESYIEKAKNTEKIIQEQYPELIEKMNLHENDALFIVADKNRCARIMGNLRTKLGNELDLIDKNRYEFCIINDFPFYEENEETGAIEFSHNPFSMPKGGLDALNNKNPFEIEAFQYDFVCNGYEMASGGVRNHSPEILKKAFELVGYGEDIVRSKFPSLYEAFKYGAPPHAGMAPGIDRIIMLLKDEENIREIVPFPIGANGADAMMGCPSEAFPEQLKEAHIKLDI